MDWLTTPPESPSEKYAIEAESRQKNLTKPSGSLGELENIAIKLAALQKKSTPSSANIHITIFAADHGVAEENVSAFPQSVTGEMIRNFSHGGAAISVLARELNASLEVINLGTVNELEPLYNVKDHRLGNGTNNFTKHSAMSNQQTWNAIHAGRQAAERVKLKGAELFIGGEMGISNTTSATALSSVLLGVPVEQLIGPGTGINETQIKHKISTIEKAITLHKDEMTQPIDVLSRLGGFEIAALAGSYISCAKIGLPVLIDGFISSAAALIAEKLSPGSKQWFLFSHQSAEPGHKLILNALDGRPLLNIGMRLGEASGAATAIPLIRLACALHNEMTTFSQANVAKENIA